MSDTWEDRALKAEAALDAVLALGIETFHINAPGEPNIVCEGGTRFAHERDVAALLKIVREARNLTAPLISEVAQSPRWEVQTSSMCSGWENCWHEGDELQTYATKTEAQADLDNYLAELAEDGDEADPAEYRVVEVKP